MTSLFQPAAALPPPQGQTSNFELPYSVGKWSILCVSVILSITTILIILRTYVRLGIKREWIFEDYMCCISWAFLVTFCALITTIMHKHGDIHGWDSTVMQMHQAKYWDNVATIIYAPAILSTKLAILLLYRRVFSPHRRGAFDLSIRILIAILCGFYLATAFVKIWECTPRERIWNSSVPGRCINVDTLISTSGVFNSVTDVIILIMPIKGVWDLNTTYRRKLGVVLVFTVGFIAPAFSVIGVVVRFRANGSPDVVFHQGSIMLWAAAEIATGLICVCSPPLAVLAHPSRPRRPSQSTLNGESNSRSQKMSGRRRAASTDEEILFDRRDIEMERCETGWPATTVSTGIVGGARSYEQGKSLATHQNVSVEEARLAGILRTVRMEQTYL